MLIVEFVLMICFGVRYYRTKRTAGKKALVWKALATFMAVLAAVAFAMKHNDILSWVMVAGTVMCMAADVLLELWLLAGVGCFGMAHICFIAAFYMEGYYKSYTPVIFMILLGIMLIIFLRFFKVLKWLSIPGTIYSVLLCSMTAMAVTGAMSQGSVGSLLGGAGGLCFFISDVVLGYSTLAKKKEKGYGALVLILYFPAVYLLAVSGL